MGLVLMENRSGLAVDATLTHATGTAEREATLILLERRKATGRITPGAGKAPDTGPPILGPRQWACDASPFVTELRARRVTPHIAAQGSVSKPGKVRRTAIDRRTTCHPGHAN